MTIVDWINSIADFGEWAAGRKPVAKKADALRFGILGAAKIGPSALVIPARSHAEVIVVAVAARDKKKAEAYAKRWDIPIVHDSYEALIADASIDCIYNPLPNGLHYGPTLAALKAGKHVLLEKPSVSNAQEARSLFYNPILQSPSAPILLEASHYRFHPAWHLFLSQFDKSQVEYASARAAVPKGFFPSSDIRFDYTIAGGCAMDLGHYTLSAVRSVVGSEPTEVLSATPRLIPAPYDQRCDQAMEATYAFPSGATGHVYEDLGARGGYPLPWLTANWPSFRDCMASVSVRLRQEELGVEESEGGRGLRKVRRKSVTMHGFMGPHAWHRIDVEVVTMWIKDEDMVVKEEREVQKLKKYKWDEGEGVGEEWWPTYRYMLEEFVNRVRGREGSGKWIEADESVKQMVATDKTYEKAGLGMRPSREGVV